MAAGTKDLVIEQGASFRLVLTWSAPPVVADDGSIVTPAVPYDLTGAQARLQVRQAPGRTVLVEASTDNGGITLGGTDGRIEIVLTPEQTAGLTVRKARYDLLVGYPDTDRYARVIEGKVAISPAITANPAVTA